MKCWAALAVTLALVSLAGCASNVRPSMPTKQIDRLLAVAPGEAQPSKLVAVEIGFAQLARDKGLSAAYRETAAPGAVIHLASGPQTLATGLDDASDREPADSWRPRAVWTSCNGAMAVSQGRYIDARDRIGSFATVWQRQRDGGYLWSYRIRALDIPQPPARAAREEAGIDEIVVTAMDSIKGIVADCPDAENPLPEPTRTSISAGERQGRLNSADDTLRIVWTHADNGERQVSADYFSLGKWQNALDRSFPDIVQ